jgi:hypothetical protein
MEAELLVWVSAGMSTYNGTRGLAEPGSQGMNLLIMEAENKQGNR